MFNKINLPTGKYENETQNCLHEGCPDCHGTGRDKDGRICIHHLSCPCKKCTPTY